ncbi:uncharacterized protein LOC752929 [Strongylocentrotus purpuratus]|uniref:G-protein coupled receptors family 2 profile 2 domain-containing protein n=1 Tax=Strongylocentrotus purpuratus TaxID=7668 RepID=A0A7M7G0U3_STRPU|nr:uncharacterized protein LOC752929 [Strongylocentrotus purpuratus]
MDRKYVASIAFLQLVIFLAVRLTASDQTFNGIAELVIESSNFSLSDDFFLNLETSLESMVSGDVDNVVVPQNRSTEADRIMISFRGLFDDFEPVCLRNNTFYYENGVANLSYSIASVSMQNFPNDFEKECTDNEKNVAYVGYFEEDCQFRTLDCEVNLDLKRLYRYEIHDSWSVLYSFFCISVNPDEESETGLCTDAGDWLRLRWEQQNDSICTIDEDIFGAFKPELLFIDDTGIEEIAPVYTLPYSLNCLTTIAAPPIIPLRGDQTWDKLPDWLKVCLQILNGVSLAALLFCLFTFVMFKELRNTYGKNVMSLVVAGLLSLCYTSGYIPLETDNPQLCVFIATLIYYFVLVPNYWWTAVAIFLAWTLGRKGIHRMDDVSGSRFFLLLSLFGWGLPLIFSLLAVFLHIGGIKIYDIDEYCWIIDGWPTYLITTQSFIPFLVDCVLFVLVVYRLRATRLDVASMDSGGNNRRRNERQLTIKMAAIFGVLWLPSWIFYVAFLFRPITSLAIIAQLLNQLSTFILPIVLCCNKRVATLWKAKFAPLRDHLSSLTHSTSLTDSHNTQTHSVKDKAFNHSDEPPVDGNDIQLRDIKN